MQKIVSVPVIMFSLLVTTASLLPNTMSNGMYMPALRYGLQPVRDFYVKLVMPDGHGGFKVIESKIPAEYQRNLDSRECTLNRRKYRIIRRICNKLDYDLNGNPYERTALVIPKQDVKQIKAMAKKELLGLSIEQLLNSDYVNQIMGSVMQQQVIAQSKKIGEQVTSDQRRIAANAQAIGNSFATRLENCPNREGQALQQFYGEPLKNMVTSALTNPTYNQ